MKRLICAAFSFKEGYQTSMQTKKDAGDKTTEIYLKNIYVTLASAKCHNPEEDVCLFTNVALPSEWTQRYQSAGVQTRILPFDMFVLPKEYTWALAYYKLCTLYHITHDADFKEYAQVLLMDTDTFTTRPYTALWKEAEKGVLLFEVGHAYTHPDREVIRRDYEMFFPGEGKNIVHYGGEFVAGATDWVRSFSEECLHCFETVTSNNEEGPAKNAGDETILSIAAARTDVPIYHAGAYLYRFWTGKVFYLVSTVTESNPVCIWHIPNEKETGFLRMYEKAIRGKNAPDFPNVKEASRLFGMRKASRPFSFGDVLFKLKRKLQK